MGAGLAERLVAAGYKVHIYNRTPEKMDYLAKQGAIISKTPKQAAEGSEAVFSMVGDDEASKAMWFGVTAALAAMIRQNAFTIECSTFSHSWVMVLVNTAQKKNLRHIDCPVIGNRCNTNSCFGLQQ